MHDHTSIENILGRLMPPALSEQGHRGIEVMLDELASELPGVGPRPQRWWIIYSGIAATLMAGFFGTLLLNHALPMKGALATAETPGSFILMSEGGRIEAVSDEGWSESPDGAALRALRLRVVEENRVFDEETGIVMNISQPREELLLMPVNAF